MPFPRISVCLLQLRQPQVLRRHYAVLQHKPHSRHRISIDHRLLQLDPLRAALVLDIPETKRGLYNSTPLLPLLVRDFAIDTLEPNISLSMTERGPPIFFLPVPRQHQLARRILSAWVRS